MRRSMLLWQIADLFGFTARLRLWWAIQSPDTYGTWLRDVGEVAP